MILNNNIGNTFALTLQSTQTAYTFKFQYEANEYIVNDNISCLSATTRCNIFNYTPHFEFNGLYTYYVYDSGATLITEGLVRVDGTKDIKTFVKDTITKKTYNK